MSDTYRILVVEDDEQIRDGIEIYLKSQGYHLYILSNYSQLKYFFTHR